MSSTAATMGKSRVPQIDAARGIAVVAMVIYHFSWDLGHFGVISTDVGSDPGWRLFAKAIAASFLIIVGISLERAGRNGIRWRAFARRLAILCGAALFVTIGSYLAFPDRYIFFGILHMIAVGSVLALPFLRLPAGVVLAAAMLAIVLPGLVEWDGFNHPALVWIGLGTVLPATNDFEPVFPWLGWILLGIAFGKLRLSVLETVENSGRPAVLEGLGRWSLPIYLVHQPVLFALFLAASSLGLLPKVDAARQYVPACVRSCSEIGVGAHQCTQICQCSAEKLKLQPYWPRVLSNTLTGPETEAMMEIGRQCSTNP